MLRERNWTPKCEACSRIRKRFVTIWVILYNYLLSVFNFCCAGETQTTKNCMVKLKLWLRLENRVILKIFDIEFLYKRSYFDPLCLPSKIASETMMSSFGKTCCFPWSCWYLFIIIFHFILFVLYWYYSSPLFYVYCRSTNPKWVFVTFDRTRLLYTMIWMRKFWSIETRLGERHISIFTTRNLIVTLGGGGGVESWRF